jgi:peptide/nickel transport system substrate-binding protein
MKIRGQVFRRLALETNYWTQFGSGRFSRRRVLRGGASVGLGAAALALLACSGDDDSGEKAKAPVDKSGLLVAPKDESTRRKRGGTLNIGAPAPGVQTATLDQNLAGNGSGSVLVHSTYSQLMRAKIGTYDHAPPASEWEPEFAQSYEQSPDGLKVTFRLRGMKFDNRPPTNGRVSTSADVKYSWDRWEKGNVRAPELSNAKASDAPVTKVETPDAQTVVFTLAFPFAPFFAYLGSAFFPFIYPQEAERYETRSMARGTGPWTLPDERPTGNAFMDRNPNYYHTGEPYFDKLNMHNVFETAQLMAQMKAGALDFNLGLTQENQLILKKDNPKMVLYQRPYYAKGCGAIFFGRRPGSPWNDDRVRKALALSMDAELWGENYSGKKQFEAEGLPVEVSWFARAGPGYSWYLDPKKGELGSVGKNIQHNPAEAKKMLQATGMKLPIESTWHSQPNPARDPLYQGMMGIYEENGDFKFKNQPWTDANQYLNTIRNTGGNFEGHSIAFYFDHHDYDWTMYLMYNPQSTDFWLGKEREDPKMTDFVNRQRRELDPKKREKIFQDFVKYDIEKMYFMPYHFPMDFKPYFVGQPWLGGWGWYQPYIEQYPNGAGQILTQYWYDESKKS